MLTRAIVCQSNLRFELANVLFNLAAMYSQLAFSANRSTSDGLKTACNYFQLAAGVISHLRISIVPQMRSIPPEDMDAMTLECIEHLMLAQAQECFWQKAIKDGLTDASIAKLAAPVSDLYMQAGDLGIKSEAISSEWIHHTFAKHHHFAAAAQFRAACDCLEKRKYGEEVARLRDALACVNEALKEARYINKVVQGDLGGLKTKVQEDLKRAEKDNDVIYLMPVPPKSELKPLERKVMVLPKVPKEVSDPISMLGEHGDLGQPLFSKLVPYSVHVAARIYEDRRDQLLNNGIIKELEGLTARIHERLRSFNLPGSLQALEKPLGIPPGLVSHAEEIRQQDGLNRLHRSIEDTERQKNDDRAIYQEGVDLLRSEAAEDEQARRRHGTDRWNRLSSREEVPKLYQQMDEIEGYFAAAAKTDEQVKSKLRSHKSLIGLLCGTDRDLEDYVPSSRRTTMTAKVEREANRLRAVLNEIGRLENRRRRKIENLKLKAKTDDINPELLREAGRLEREFPMQKIETLQFEDLFEQRLRRYDADKQLVSEEEVEQQDICKRLQEAHAAFAQARRGDSSTNEREQALQSLENAYFKYKEIVSNIEVGRKFYNDLAKIVSRFREECRNFTYQRRMEAGRLENDTSASMTSLTLSKSNAETLQSQRDAEAEKPPYAERPPIQSPLTAPKPTRPVAPTMVPQSAGVWNPDMGIKFAGITTPNGGKEGRAGGGRWDPSKGVNFG